MRKYVSKKNLYFLINHIILIMNLSITNLVLNTLTPTPRWYVNVLSIVGYILWLYFFIKNNKEREIQITKINVLLGSFTLALFCISNITMFSELIKENGVESVLKSYGGYGKTIYLAICFLQPIILPLPEPIIITAGNIVLGPILGFLLGYFGTVLGIVTMFIISRVVNRKLHLTITSSKNLERYNNLIEKNETFILIFLFIFPILPDEIICIAAGLSLIKFSKFLFIAIFSKFLTVGMYSVSSGIVKDILELSLFYQLTIIFVITIVIICLKKLIYHIKRKDVLKR